jgi:dynein light intermediate chain 1
MKKISILHENMQSMKPDDYYRDVIVQPVLRKVSHLHGRKYALV